ncbi:MAG: hypothetical protein A2W97_11985 [Bacteroidetes bacterium GWE2_40_63]|jgi:hypothetical protein|nr:MAG: hypothetical protein A2W95_04795 [Bacteroidetes bacterium GWA2_40_14]OFX60425.1 MAG: hypothetical protein A2W84_04880 [Bacteroidetes bacterium GWC2_40_13]OFX74475.1 MAG: hypothetical protein A2W96_02935 [Bacteroidetes bacterium GWD2_40_43]OFX91887.1 MAG: hypothetical protein A2W97_11985 [Bacteroidetes bacterium GWE2_40_63]OFY19815.1 MAG: hypothetical protein A2W88_03450 [Bacteroidetes bacterium GWF2_40_13]OFZ28226.1 MAG: hypothetical protein A2437_04955 [Bacteroidetes bacterium RIFOXYC
MKKLLFSLTCVVAFSYFSVGQELIQNGNFSLPDNGTKYLKIDSIPNWCTDATTADENGREFVENNGVAWIWDESKSIYQVIGTVPSTETSYAIGFDITCTYTWWADYITDYYIIFSTFTGTDTTNRAVLDSVKFTYNCASANWSVFAHQTGTYVIQTGNAHAGENLVAEIKIFNSADFGYGSSYTYLQLDNVSIIKSGTGVAENQFSDLKVFPVPAKNVMTVSNNQFIEKVTLFDITGKEIKKEWINKSEANLNIETIPSGVYFLNILSNGQSVTRKVVVE